MPTLLPTSAIGLIFASRATSISDLTVILFFPPASSRRRLNMGLDFSGFRCGRLEGVAGADARGLRPFGGGDLLAVGAAHALGEDGAALGCHGHPLVVDRQDTPRYAVAGDLARNLGRV